MYLLKAIKRLESQFIPEPNSGCWIWTGAARPDGYADFWFNGKRVLAHRFSYEAHNGTVPQGLSLDHKCRIRLCVNPDHLEPVTNRINVIRGCIARGRKTHCPKGHPYSGDNLYINPKTKGQICLTCFRQYRKLWDKRNRSRDTMPWYSIHGETPAGNIFDTSFPAASTRAARRELRREHPGWTILKISRMKK